MTTSAQTVATGKVTGVDLVAYFTADPERSIAFYRDVLGMNPTETDEQGRGAEFTLADGTTFGVWKPDEPASGACVMLAVDDIQVALRSFRERGAKLSDPEETPVCYMSFGSDPDGNTICIHQRKA